MQSDTKRWPRWPAVAGWCLGSLTLAGEPAMGQAHSPAAPERTGLLAAEQASAPALLLAKEWAEGASPQGYLVSEKFDGVRAYWDGHRLRFRGGGAIAAPAWFLAQLPAGQPLDGELWLGRGQFDATSALLRRGQDNDPGWQALRYLVFELPHARGSFAERVALLEALAAQHPSTVWRPLEQRRVPDAAALRRQLLAVTAQGGEGLALHRADAPYTTGRNECLQKYKLMQDAEAVVTGYLPGQGRYAGQVGALTVRNDAGQTFHIGTGLSEAQRRQPPLVGSRVTYRWRGLTSTGLPRFASLLRLADPGL
jgi:DNA ligase-1